MIDVALAAAVVLLFVGLLRAFGLVDNSQEVIRLSTTSLGVLRDPHLPDDKKEKALQANTLRLFRHFIFLALGGAAALTIPLVLLWLGDALGWVSLDDVLAASLSPAFLIVAGVVALIAMFLPRRDATEYPDSAAYSLADRTVHRLAFRTRDAQIAVASVEDGLFGKRFERCDSDRPVFITGLPRAGTTLLLEILAATPEFASHRYRDMPFVLTPLLWEMTAGRFRRTTASQERAHGDGMRIGPDSPEALEEVLWLAFEGDQYESDRIRPWGDRVHPEFEAFFRSHLKKIILIRDPDDADCTRRYVSKNNLNIARTGLLLSLFPDCRILVPFRDPMSQAASLLRQHLHFLGIHGRDAFAKEYMRKIGHFDFGENLRPVDFDGWYDRCQSEPDQFAFWVEYWTATYRHLLDSGEKLLFVGYDALCQRPEAVLRAVARAIDSADVQGLASLHRRLHRPTEHGMDLGGVPEALQRRARGVHEGLEAVALA